MDAFDRQIVQFVVWWAPFGGPPEEDVLPRFGLTPPLLARRFNKIVSSLADAGAKLDDDDAQLLATARRVLPASRAAQDAKTHSSNGACRINVRDATSGPANSVGLAESVPAKSRPYDHRPFRQR